MTKTELKLDGGINAHQDWGVPCGKYIHDVVLEGDGTGYGIHCDASYVVFERVWIRNFYINVVLSNAVSVTFRDCHFSRAKECNLFIPGNTIATCIRFDACAFRHAPYGVTIQSGQGITFTNRCIIELNGTGLTIDPQPTAPFFGDITNDASSPIWFEANGTDLVGGQHLATK